MTDKENWVEQYKKQIPKYEVFTKKLKSLLEEIVEREKIKAIFESRTKTVESFAEKISRENKNYTNPITEITDFSGIRIITYSLRDIGKLEEIINREFKVDTEKSVNKLHLQEPDRFGYLSQHFIIQINESRHKLIEWRDLDNLFAEIQIRTTLQHAWANVEHLLVYKSEIDAPRVLRRRLSRLSALFEMADEELDKLLNEKNIETEKYKNELNKGNVYIEINVDSLKQYIDESAEPKYWIEFLRNEIGVNIYDNDWGDLSRDIRISQYFGINSISEINNLLKDAHGWGEFFLRTYYSNFQNEWNVRINDISTVKNGVVTKLLIAANAEKVTS